MQAITVRKSAILALVISVICLRVVSEFSIINAAYLEALFIAIPCILFLSLFYPFPFKQQQSVKTFDEDVITMILCSRYWLYGKQRNLGAASDLWRIESESNLFVRRHTLSPLFNCTGLVTLNHKNILTRFGLVMALFLSRLFFYVDPASLSSSRAHTLAAVVKRPLYLSLYCCCLWVLLSSGVFG